MTDLTWTATRTDTIDRFNGQTPRPEDEAPIIDLFEIHPQLVLRAIDETAAALNEGKITWAWSVLRSRLERGSNALREATADTQGSKLKAIERAKRWIDNAGVHYDQEHHVHAELFGDEYASGLLNNYDITADQQAELIAYWREQRPRGVEAERLHLEWADKCKHDRAVILERQRKEAASQPTPTSSSASSPNSRTSSSSANPEATTSSSSTEPSDSPTTNTSASSNSPTTPTSEPQPADTTAEPELAAATNPIPWP